MYMGLFDNIKNAFTSELKSKGTQAVNNAVSKGINSATNAANNVGKGKKSKQSFTFQAVPTSVDELKALPEATLDSAFKTVALTMIALCNYVNDKEATFEMLNYLKGPEDFSLSDKQAVTQRLTGKEYIVTSFFDGATVENNYTCSKPYSITVYENPYSFDEENWAMMFVKSAGADSERVVKLRKKPSTGQWFLADIQCLDGIRTPLSQDKWA